MRNEFRSNANVLDARLFHESFDKAAEDLAIMESESSKMSCIFPSRFAVQQSL
jgi:hypothetical protein